MVESGGRGGSHENIPIKRGDHKKIFLIYGGGDIEKFCK